MEDYELVLWIRKGWVFNPEVNFRYQFVTLVHGNGGNGLTSSFLSASNMVLSNHYSRGLKTKDKSLVKVLRVPVTAINARN